MSYRIRGTLSTRSALFNCTLFAALCVAWLPIARAAAGDNVPAASEVQDKSGWNGTIGVGPMLLPKYTGGTAQQVLPLPLLSINYDETVYIEVQRVGVYIFASDDKKIGLGLAAEPRLGFRASDAPRLGGMITRRASVEGGLTFDWDFDVVAFSAAWLNDLNRTSRGQSVRFTVYAPLVKSARGEIGIVASADRMNANITNYFFGVRTSEATATRPAFTPPAGTAMSIGVGGTYRIAPGKSGWGGLIFGANIGRLPVAIATSPIVETRSTRQIYLGYGWTL
ncbi:MAG: MipA/OmpV family protein [Betaproteobacteria bacterium]